MTFDEWLQYGNEQGWCGPVVCDTHEGLQTTEDEAEQDDLCLHAIRVFDSVEQRQAVLETIRTV
jgi:hypothetical protein